MTIQQIKKLTAEDLLVAAHVSDYVKRAVPAAVWAEIRRRLERLEKCEAALESIVAWEMPPTDRYWSDGTPMSYGAAYGSNGEREHIRFVARAALEE